jgi:hypothetical protein
VAVAAQKGASAEAKHAGSSMRTEVFALPTEAEDVVQVVVAVALEVWPEEVQLVSMGVAQAVVEPITVLAVVYSAVVVLRHGVRRWLDLHSEVVGHGTQAAAEQLVWVARVYVAVGLFVFEWIRERDVEISSAHLVRMPLASLAMPGVLAVVAVERYAHHLMD